MPPKVVIRRSVALQAILSSKNADNKKRVKTIKEMDLKINRVITNVENLTAAVAPLLKRELPAPPPTPKRQAVASSSAAGAKTTPARLPAVDDDTSPGSESESEAVVGLIELHQEPIDFKAINESLTLDREEWKRKAEEAVKEVEKLKEACGGWEKANRSLKEKLDETVKEGKEAAREEKVQINLAQCTSLRKQLRTVQCDLQDAKKKNKELEEELEQKDEEIKALNDRIELLETSNGNSICAIRVLERDLKEAKEKLEELGVECSQAKRDAVYYKTREEFDQGEIKVLEEKIKELRGEVAALATKIEKTEEAYQVICKENGKLRAHDKDAHEKLNAALEKIKTHRAQLSGEFELIERVKNSEGRLEEARKEIERLRPFEKRVVAMNKLCKEDPQ